MIKRDFLYEHKITLIILIAIQVLFLLLNLIMPAVTLKFYQPVYLMMLVGILFYPVMVFKKISPRVGDYFNAYSMTSHLPFSKKQLMWMGIKPWIVIAPIYLLVTTMMMAYFRAQAINQLFFELLFGGIILISFVITVVGGFVLQLLASQLIYLKYRQHWMMIAIVLIVVNIIYVASSGTIQYALQLSIDQLGWIMSSLYFCLNLVAFLFNFKKIEEIYQ